MDESRYGSTLEQDQWTSQNVPLCQHLQELHATMNEVTFHKKSNPSKSDHKRWGSFYHAFLISKLSISMVNQCLNFHYVVGKWRHLPPSHTFPLPCYSCNTHYCVLSRGRRTIYDYSGHCSKKQELLMNFWHLITCEIPPYITAIASIPSCLSLLNNWCKKARGSSGFATSNSPSIVS